MKFHETKWRNIFLKECKFLEIQRQIVKKLQVYTSDKK